MCNILLLEPVLELVSGDMPYALHPEGDTKIIPPSESSMEDIIQNIQDIEKEGNYEKAKNTKQTKITKISPKTRTRRTGGKGNQDNSLKDKYTKRDNDPEENI